MSGSVQGLQRHADQHPVLLQTGHGVGQAFVPKIFVAGDLKGHPLRVVHDQRAARHVGDHVLIVRVEVLVQVQRVQVFVVGQQALVQLLQKPRLTQDVQRIVAGQDQVVALAAGLGHLQQHVVDGVHGRPHHVDAGFIFEGLNGILIHIALPAEHVDGLGSLGQRGQSQHSQRKSQQQRQSFFHVQNPFLSFHGNALFYSITGKARRSQRWISRQIRDADVTIPPDVFPLPSARPVRTAGSPRPEIRRRSSANTAR